jgi:hypothetical protein
MAVPNIFATATAAIPLSQLDTNFATAITLGSTALYLGNTTTTVAGLTLTTPVLTNPTVTSYIETSPTQVTVGIGTTALDTTLSAGTVLRYILTASQATTFTMPTATAGKSFIMILKQAASTGNGTAVFTSVKYPGGTAPTITATAGGIDILSFVSDGTNWYGTFVQAFA